MGVLDAVDAQTVVQQDAVDTVQKLALGARLVRDVMAVARHLVVAVRVAHRVRGHAIEVVADVQAVQVVHRVVNPARGIVKRHAQGRAIALAQDARPPVQARAMMLARHRMKRRPLPTLAATSASEISSH